MNIGIYARPLENDHRYRGIGVYTERIIKALVSEFPDDKYFIIAGEPDKILAGLFPALPDNIIPVRMSIKPWEDRKYFWIYEYLRFASFSLSAQLAGGVRLDMIHFPDSIVRPYFGAAWAVTVHDLIPLVFAGLHPLGRNRRLFYFTQRFLLKAGCRLITDSKCSAGDIEKLYGVGGAAVAPLGFDFKEAEAALCRGLGAVYSLPEKYILGLYAADWRKNSAALVRIYSIYRRLASNPRPLIISGRYSEDESAYREMAREIKLQGLEEHIMFLNYSGREELVNIIKNSEALLFPSMYEGFGLPPLEALALGAPVVAFDNSSIREVVEDGYFLAPDGDYDEFARKTVHITENRLEAVERIRVMERRISEYSWARSARLTRKAFGPPDR